MSIYKHKLDDEVQAKNRDQETAEAMKDDDEVCTLRARIHDVFQVFTCFTCIGYVPPGMSALSQSINQSFFFNVKYSCQQTTATI